MPTLHQLQSSFVAVLQARQEIQTGCECYICKSHGAKSHLKPNPAVVQSAKLTADVYAGWKKELQAALSDTVSKSFLFIRKDSEAPDVEQALEDVFETDKKAKQKELFDARWPAILAGIMAGRAEAADALDIDPDTLDELSDERMAALEEDGIDIAESNVDSVHSRLRDVLLGSGAAITIGWALQAVADAFKPLEETAADDGAEAEFVRGRGDGLVQEFIDRDVPYLQFSAKAEHCDLCDEYDGLIYPPDLLLGAIPLHPFCLCTGIPMPDIADDAYVETDAPETVFDRAAAKTIKKDDSGGAISTGDLASGGLSVGSQGSQATDLASTTFQPRKRQRRANARRLHRVVEWNIRKADADFEAEHPRGEAGRFAPKDEKVASVAFRLDGKVYPGKPQQVHPDLLCDIEDKYGTELADRLINSEGELGFVNQYGGFIPLQEAMDKFGKAENVKKSLDALSDRIPPTLESGHSPDVPLTATPASLSEEDIAKRAMMELDGEWKTIRGRPVFIKTGQTINEAMKESGKFEHPTRDQMPQLKGVPDDGSPASRQLEPDKHGKVEIGDDFREYLKDNDIGVEKERVHASELKPTQTDLDQGRIDALVAAIEGGKKRLDDSRIYISKDNHILDGHHHWAAAVALGKKNDDDPKMKVYRIDLPIKELLKVAVAFSDKWGIKKKTVETPVKKGDVDGHVFHGNQWTSGITTANASYGIPKDITGKLGIEKLANLLDDIKPDLAAKMADKPRSAFMELLMTKLWPKATQQTVTEQELNEKLAEGETLMLRGVHSDAYAKRFIDGEPRVGDGVYGQGCYTAYADAGDEHESTLEAAHYAEGGPVLRMSLKADAKCVDWEHLQTLQAADMRKLRAAKNAQGVDKALAFMAIPSYYAAVKGYDVIRIPDENYMLVLNPSAIRVQKNAVKI